MTIFIVFLPAILGAVRAIISFLISLGPVISWFIAFMPRVWSALIWFGGFAGRVGGFLLSFKGFLVLFVGYVVSSFFGWGDEFTAFFVDVVYFVCDLFFDFFFHEEDGLVWYIFDCGISFGIWFQTHTSLLDVFVEPVSRYNGAIAASMELIGRMNQFIPIVEAGFLFGLFITFILFFLGVKLFLKLIPGMG